MNTSPPEIWTDPTSPPTSPLRSSSPSPSPSPTSTTSSSSHNNNHKTALTQHQHTLVSTYLYHRGYETSAMNTIVELEISVRRERDEPGVAWLRRELAGAQRVLAVHREGRRKGEGRLRVEVERLRRVGRETDGRERDVVGRQVVEIERVMGRRRRAGVCLR
ncbi:hypothetical protein ACJQWK_08351 [Exserohilum turcicum]|uniref:Uncharacterized protein n=1 Tax=Exserohilum turcicum (strain 28A) TaxID=671987 RepID=R0KBQ8_EXST2|nr:uncharacterized protein SETTUDRAFT_31150 [Exserohilum turcica Et28A]EOA86834.1 hypothetical protein SETTUDRAFT_31150 [Exserohilum turcica Et28A]